MASYDQEGSSHLGENATTVATHYRDTDTARDNAMKRSGPIPIGDVMLEHQLSGDVSTTQMLNDIDLLASDVDIKQWVDTHDLNDNRRLLTALDIASAEHSKRAAVLNETSEVVRSHLHSAANINRDVPMRG